MSYDGGEVYLYDYAEFGPQIVNELKKKVDALEIELNEKRAKEMKDLALIDSLYQVSLAMEDELATLKGVGGSFPNAITSLSGDSDIDKKIQEVSKSLLRLDEEELQPILNRLSDSHLYKLYLATTGVQREKLLRSLEPAKSAVLLKRVMS